MRSGSSDKGIFTFSEGHSISKSTLLSVGTLTPQEGEIDIRRALPGINELKDIKTIFGNTADLRSQLKQPGYDITGDYKIFRFLLAHDGDVHVAESCYRKYLEERIKNDNYIERVRGEVAQLNPEEFSKWWLERCHPFMPIFPVCGETADRDVLVWIRVGILDADRVVDERPKNLEFIQSEERLYLSLWEWMNIQIEQRTRDTGKMIYCVKLFDFLRPRDWEKISPKPRFPLYRWIFLQYFTKAGTWGNMLYPEMDRIIVVTNPTSMFKWFWKFAHPMLKKRTISKIRIVNNTKQTDDQNILYQFVPRELMPRPWGGKGVDPNIAKEYAMSHGERLLKLDNWRQTRHDFEKDLPNLNRKGRHMIINKGYDNRRKNSHESLADGNVSRSLSFETDGHQRMLYFMNESEGSNRHTLMKNKLALSTSDEGDQRPTPPAVTRPKSPPPPALMCLKSARILAPTKTVKNSSSNLKKSKKNTHSKKLTDVDSDDDKNSKDRTHSNSSKRKFSVRSGSKGLSKRGSKNNGVGGSKEVHLSRKQRSSSKNKVEADINSDDGGKSSPSKGASRRKLDRRPRDTNSMNILKSEAKY